MAEMNLIQKNTDPRSNPNPDHLGKASGLTWEISRNEAGKFFGMKLGKISERTREKSRNEAWKNLGTKLGNFSK